MGQVLVQKPLQTLADLLVSEILATRRRFLAATHGFDETGFFFEVPCKGARQEFVRIAALAGCGVSELRIEFMPEVDFHGWPLLPLR